MSKDGLSVLALAGLTAGLCGYMGYKFKKQERIAKAKLFEMRSEETKQDSTKEETKNQVIVTVETSMSQEEFNKLFEEILIDKICDKINKIDPQEEM